MVTVSCADPVPWRARDQNALVGVITHGQTADEVADTIGEPGRVQTSLTWSQACGS